LLHFPSIAHTIANTKQFHVVIPGEKSYNGNDFEKSAAGELRNIK
jgi:hypothetical protein